VPLVDCRALAEPGRRALPPPPDVGDMKEIGGLPPRRAAAPVVAARSAHVGVPGEALDRGDVRAPVEEVAHVSPVERRYGRMVSESGVSLARLVCGHVPARGRPAAAGHAPARLPTQAPRGGQAVRSRPRGRCA